MIDSSPGGLAENEPTAEDQTLPPTPAPDSRPEDDGGLPPAPADSGAVRSGRPSGPDSHGSAGGGESAPSSLGAADAESTSLAKLSDIKSMDDLLRYAYGEGGKKLAAPKSIYANIERNTEYPLDGEPAYRIVQELSKDDRLLGVPPRLLIHADDADAPIRVRRRLLDCMSYALRLHPVFQPSALQSVLNRAPDPHDVDSAFDLLKETVDTGVPRTPADQGQKLKDSERARLRTNAITALALVLALRDGWAVDRLVECLYRHLWTLDSTVAGAFRPKAAIAESRTPEVLAAVARVFHRRATDAERQLAEISRLNEQLINRVFTAEQETESRDLTIEELRKDLLGLESRIAELEAVIERERYGRVVDQSHHLDDYEALRTRIVRLLDRESRLLTDGLHALRNDRPTIADEFIERALDAFDRELQQLRDREASS